MRPPICAICRVPFSPSKTTGKLVYFKESEADKTFNEGVRKKRMVGHPAGREWFCEVHIEQAQKLQHLTFQEALKQMNEK